MGFGDRLTQGHVSGIKRLHHQEYSPTLLVVTDIILNTKYLGE